MAIDRRKAPMRGGASMSNPHTADGAYYAWRHLNPAQAEDPRVAFAAGTRSGRRAMFDDSARWIALEPLLQDVLDELVQLRIEREIAASDMRDACDFEDMPEARDA
jgi:hypothetical protein